ncbi:MAG TPA: protein kinase [Gemmatimonadaceae bacterium]|nr:protein kinase [Gemmatimonadaceae bacterium]
MDTELGQHLRDSLSDTYTLEREIVGAGMSRVFVAEDRALGRRVVIKVLPPEMAAAVRLERFRREIQLAASLTHPHIIPLLTAGETLGLPYYTMPYVEGESLKERLKRDWRLPIAEAVRLACEAARALDYAHRSGVIHRDMKPGNVLLHDGHAMITDFGIARALNVAAADPNLTSAGTAIGTPAYMSPEQGMGEPTVDGRTDIYALACVLFEMLSGSAPYVGRNAQQVMMRHFVDPIPSVRAGRSDIPVTIDEAIRKALAKQPAGRFGSAADFAAALEAGHVNWTMTPESVAAISSSTKAHDESGPTAAVNKPLLDRFVAVLPFENMSSDPENEYFSDGITEDIITNLSKIPTLKVMSRTSTAPYKKHGKNVREIGRELGVSHVLEGSVRRARNKVRVTAQLIDTETDQHVWAKTWDRELDDIFAVQTDVAECVAHCLRAKLSPADVSRLAKKPTNNIEAYNLYLLGRHHYNKVTPDDFAKAVEYLKKAVELDPEFATALASLAEAYQYFGMGYWGIRPHDAHPEAFKLATKAAELDPNNGSAHASLGLYHDWYRFEFDKGGAELERAVELYPSGSMLRMYYAMHLCVVGKFDDAMVHRDIACQLDPSAMAIRGNATWVLYLARRMDQAIEECRNIRAIDPTSSYAAFSHGLVGVQTQHKREGIQAFRDAARLGEGITLYQVSLAYGLAAGGEHQEARELLEKLEQLAKTEFVWPMGMAMAYAHLGEESIAMDWLEKAYDERVGYMLMINRDPALDVLRNSPRFERLAQQIGPKSSGLTTFAEPTDRGEELTPQLPSIL